MINLINLACLMAMLLLLPSCSPLGEDSRLSPSETDRTNIEAFKMQSGSDRLKAWEQLQPSLTNRLASVPKTRPALKNFFEQWLGPSEDRALKRCEDGLVRPFSPESHLGDIFAYQLSYENYFSEDLVVDFRNPEKVTIGILRGYAPPEKKTQHDDITLAEKRTAAELNATEINLAGSSQDGSAKPGYWVQLKGRNLNITTAQKAATLSTLVSLQLSGAKVTDEWLALFANHGYLASLELVSTSITDDGLTNLVGLSALKWLTIVNGRNVTKDGVNALKAALPKCEIEFREK